MGDYTKNLEAKAAAVLEADEQLLAGARGMSSGSTAQIAAGGAGAVAGGAVGSAVADKATRGRRQEGRQQEAAAGLGELPPQLAVGLTTKRLLVFKRGSLSGKPKELVAELPRESITAIAGEDSGSMVKPDRLHVRLTDERAVTFEIVKKDGYQGIVDAFAG